MLRVLSVELGQPQSTRSRIEADAYRLLLSFVLRGGLDGLQYPVQKELLGQRPFDRSLLVDNGLRHSVNAVLSGQVRELGCLDAVCRDEVVLHGEAVGQAHGLGAMGSS